MYYRVIKAKSIEEMEMAIKNCMDAGFTPYGGISVIDNSTAHMQGLLFFQAIVNEHE